MKPFNLILFFLFCLFAFKPAFAQTAISNFNLLNKTVKEYEKAEWDINIAAPFTNPYDSKDITLDLFLTSPSGKPVVLPCYFENGNEQASLWRARFAPQEAGQYSYYFGLKSKKGFEKSAEGNFTSMATDKKGFLHKNNLWTFKYDNGQLFRGIGENVGWESRTFEKDKWTYDYLLPKLANNGANFFRTWMCYWNLPLEWRKVSSTKRYQNSDAYFNPGAIKRMDELVNLTDSLHLHFMLTLDWHGHLMEDGGWKNSNYNQANGGPAKTPADFFASQAARAKYKNKLRYIIARWGYSTSIAAFEFFNEVDNAVFNQADSILIPHHLVSEWHAEMSRYIKDADPYGHMVTTSVSHRDIGGMNSIPYMDFNQKHIYKHTEKIPAIYSDYIQTFGKPYVVGEFGFRWEDDDQRYGREADYDFKRGLWYGLFSPTPLLPMSWWWEMFDTRNMEPYFKGVRQISNEMLKAGNGSFEQFPVVTDRVEAYGVKCRSKYFVYLLNNTGQDINTPVSFKATGKTLRIAYFDPATLMTTEAPSAMVVNQEIVLKNVKLKSKTELIVVLNNL